jgi:hypothetical protein
LAGVEGEDRGDVEQLAGWELGEGRARGWRATGDCGEDDVAGCA